VYPGGEARGACRSAGKPGGGIRDARELDLDAGSGTAATLEVSAGKKETGRESSGVRKSRSAAEGVG
jgi:hypothetical protein